MHDCIYILYFCGRCRRCVVPRVLCVCADPRNHVRWSHRQQKTGIFNWSSKSLRPVQFRGKFISTFQCGSELRSGWPPYQPAGGQHQPIPCFRLYWFSVETIQVITILDCIWVHDWMKRIKESNFFNYSFVWFTGILSVGETPARCWRSQSHTENIYV